VLENCPRDLYFLTGTTEEPSGLITLKVKKCFKNLESLIFSDYFLIFFMEGQDVVMGPSQKLLSQAGSIFLMHGSGLVRSVTHESGKFPPKTSFVFNFFKFLPLGS